jgi:acyl-CoA reductase-like NAD-dependent aldehyde dehydrogenase
MNFDADYTMTVDGKAVAGAANFPVLNPATEVVIAHAPDCSREQLDATVMAARKAFSGWRAVPIERRRELIVAMAARMAANSDPLMRLLTREQGKPHASAQAEVLGGLRRMGSRGCWNTPLRKLW